ncbi:MAG: 2-dehydropantoate 2-reductase [Dehalococcoidia bacterium]|nr:2-dehydropantoate 2-reductase [Dehalococcoidia bacterium]
MKAMNILVMGAGAVGSAVGGFLGRGGHRVSLVGRDPHMAAIRERGLRIEGIWGEHLIRGLRVFTSVQEVPREHFDLVLVTTKSYDTGDAAREILPLLLEDSLVISLQNGLGNVETISQIVGDQRAVGGRLIFGIEVPEAGRVEITVYADKVMLGSPSHKVDFGRLEAIAAAFTGAGIPTQATMEIGQFIWGKVFYNCCLNPLSALLEVTYGELSEHSQTRQIMTSVMEEIFAVAGAKGVSLAWRSPLEYQEVLFGRLIPDTYAHHASMLQDVMRGNRTEIDALNGAIAKMGRETGIPTPVNLMLTQLIEVKEQIGKGRVLETPGGQPNRPSAGTA